MVTGFDELGGGSCVGPKLFGLKRSWLVHLGVFLSSLPRFAKQHRALVSHRLEEVPF